MGVRVRVMKAKVCLPLPLPLITWRSESTHTAYSPPSSVRGLVGERVRISIRVEVRGKGRGRGRLPSSRSVRGLESALGLRLGVGLGEGLGCLARGRCGATAVRQG